MINFRTHAESFMPAAFALAIAVRRSFGITFERIVAVSWSEIIFPNLSRAIGIVLDGDTFGNRIIRPSGPSMR